MERVGNPDVSQFIQNGLVVTRSGLVIVACGGISLIVTGLLFLLPIAERKEEQTAPSNGA